VNVTFGVELDANTGNVSILGLNTIPLFVPSAFSALIPGTGWMFLGMSPGNGATDPGFVPAGPGFFRGRRRPLTCSIDMELLER